MVCPGSSSLLGLMPFRCSCFVCGSFGKPMQASARLFNFSLEEVQCYCCQRNHVDPSGNRIQICDRQVLLQCIGIWFGTLEAFEQSVQAEVLPCLLKELSSHFFTYRHCVTATIPLLWSYLDLAAAILHYLDQYPGRTWRSAMDDGILRGASGLVLLIA